MGFELNSRPVPGQVLFYVDLSQIKSYPVGEAETRLANAGYLAQLRYLRVDKAVVPVLLLIDELHINPIPEDYLGDQFDAVAELLAPDYEAVHCPRMQPRKEAVAV